MPKLTHDPLLSATRLIILALQGLTILFGVVMLVSIPVILANAETVLVQTRLVDHTSTADEIAAIARGVAAGAALVAGMIALAFRFLLELRRLVDTVGEGDPFVSANADRLRRMAWLTLAVHGLVWLTAPIFIWIDSISNREAEGYPLLDASVTLTGVAMALVLFVLARVFRRGAAMRQDLEGTV